MKRPRSSSTPIQNALTLSKSGISASGGAPGEVLISHGAIAVNFGKTWLTGGPLAWVLGNWRVAGTHFYNSGFPLSLTNSAALVTAAFPRARLGQGMGIYLASFSVAQLLGPTVGGGVAAAYPHRLARMAERPK